MIRSLIFRIGFTSCFIVGCDLGLPISPVGADASTTTGAGAGAVEREDPPPAPLVAAGIRIDTRAGLVGAQQAQACRSGRCALWTTVQGVVSQQPAGPISVRVFNPAGVMIDEILAVRSADTMPGPTAINSWEAQLPLPLSGFDHHQIVASNGQHTARLMLLDEHRAFLSELQHEPCTDDTVCGLLRQEDPGFSEMLTVTRDNPTLFGDITLSEGEIARRFARNENSNQWLFGFGTTALNATKPPLASVRVERDLAEVTGFPGQSDLPASVNQSVTPLRADSNARTGQQAAWRTTAGSLSHDRLYFAQPEIEHRPVHGSVKAIHGSRLYMRLSDDVLLVPVVVVTWINPAEDAGPATWQQRQALEALRLFDFDDAGTDRFWIGDVIDSTDRVDVASEQPPDNIWAQCGIQFQVVGLVFADQEPNRSCGTQALYRNFAEADETEFGVQEFFGLGLVVHKMRTKLDRLGRDLSWLAPRVQELNPIIYNLGVVGGCTFAGSTYAPANIVEVDTDSYFGVRRSSITTAHELGHALLGSNSHCEEMSGKTTEECRAEDNLMVSFADNERTIRDCDQARLKALELSNRFRVYRDAIE